jgi:glucokinase
MALKNIMLGIDIGGTNTVFGFVRKSGIVLEEYSIPTQSKKPAKDLVKQVKKEISTFLKKNENKFNLAGIGIGAPNANYYTGLVENPPNLKWGDVDLVGIVTDILKVPVKITNDANASALGELLFGAGKGMKDLITITLGTGLGSGIVVNGKLVYGSNGYAGEFGHVCIDFRGRYCACGKRGCLEGYVSATGIVRTAIELLGKRICPSKLRDLPCNKITAKMIYDLAISGDEIALETFDFTAHLLGVSCANVAMISAPEAIIICGGLAQAGDLLLKKTKDYMEEQLIKNYKNQIQILPSGIKKGNSAVIGAAALAWKEFGHI